MMRNENELYEASMRVAERGAKLLDTLESFTRRDASEEEILSIVAAAYVAGVQDGRDEAMENRSEWM